MARRDQKGLWYELYSPSGQERVQPWIAVALMTLEKGWFPIPLPERQPKAFSLTWAGVGAQDVWAGTLVRGEIRVCLSDTSSTLTEEKTEQLFSPL